MHVLRRPDIVIEVLAAIALALDMVALRRLWTSAFYERRQQWLQSVLVLLLPVAGAWLILYLCRTEMPKFQAPPRDSLGDFDISDFPGGHHD